MGDVTPKERQAPMLPAHPVMALRPDQEDAELLDDIVVQDVTMFRAEAMDNDVWWLCCYFANGESVTFHLRARCRPTRLEFSVTDQPNEWIDWDEHPEARNVAS